ncbi:MAG: LCP family protein [Candidatus Peregrinibacteria bacterium]|nr:LCP family protein [Candidatus Peregrinibacteria bacterium]
MSFQTRRISGERPLRKFPWRRVLLVAELARPLLRWYQHWRERRQEEEKRMHRVDILKRILLIALALLCAVVLFVGIAKALISLEVVSFRGILDVAGTDLPHDANGFTNVLLLGQGDDSHDGQDLTDTLMVASIDPTETKSVVLLSLPRDLYMLSTEKMGRGRINSLYRDYKAYLRKQGLEEKEASLEAMKELAKEVGEKMNLPIHHVVKVDFIGFVKAVDALGGVDITVPYDIVDTEYPGPNYSYQTFQIAAGPQHLDGETALKYVRSRHTSSDFGRSARQQQLLSALGDQAKQLGILSDPGKITEIARILQENMETTMSARELIGGASLGMDIERDRIITMQLNDHNGLYGTLTNPGGFLYTPPRDQFEGAFVLLPVSIPEFPVTWKQIHALTDLLFRRRSLYMNQPRIHLLNAGAKSGLGRLLGAELTRYGFTVSEITNATLPEKLDQSLIGHTGEQQEPLGAFLATLLNLPSSPLPADLPAEERAPVTIILGKDFQYTPLQDLIPSLP